MLITKETDYALRILRALAAGEQLTTEQLARKEQIPLQFAYKILKKLSKGGLVRTLRGAGGGCVLEVELKNVSFLRLLRTMEEDAIVSSCMKPGYRCSWREEHGSASCCTHVQLSAIQEKLNRELESHSLWEILFAH